MAYQIMFKESYDDSFRKSIKEGKDLDRYTKNESPFIPKSEYLVKCTTVMQPENLCEKMMPYAQGGGENDFMAGKLLFEEYPISNMLASYAPFWDYLSHVELFKYVKNRWPKVNKEDTASSIQYIFDHWFFGSRNGQWLADLWWSFKISVREDLEDKYAYTKVLFKNQDWRSRTGGHSSVFRHKPAADAIIEFFIKHENDVFKKNMLYKTRYMMKYINRLGGSKYLMALDKDYFTQVLEAKIPDIQKVEENREQQNKDAKKKTLADVKKKNGN